MWMIFILLLHNVKELGTQNSDSCFGNLGTNCWFMNGWQPINPERQILLQPKYHRTTLSTCLPVSRLNIPFISIYIS